MLHHLSRIVGANTRKCLQAANSNGAPVVVAVRIQPFQLSYSCNNFSAPPFFLLGVHRQFLPRMGVWPWRFHLALRPHQVHGYVSYNFFQKTIAIFSQNRVTLNSCPCTEPTARTPTALRSRSGTAGRTTPTSSLIIPNTETTSEFYLACTILRGPPRLIFLFFFFTPASNGPTTNASISPTG